MKKSDVSSVVQESENILLNAPAKINLRLKISTATFVHPLRPHERLHPIQSTLLKIPLYDTLRIRKISQKKIILYLDGPFAPGLPNNAENSVYRAASSFFERTGFSAGIECTLTKNIPARSGLGGASSDAAVVLRGLQQLFPEKAAHFNAQDWNDLALELGSDVPFFWQEGRCAEISGFGERVRDTPISDRLGDFLIIALFPRISCSTAWAYAALDHFRVQHSEAQLPSENDFEPPIFAHFPDLRKLRDELLSSGAECAGLTGSGSAIYAFFSAPENAQIVSEKLKKRCAFLKVLDLSEPC